MSVRFVWNKTSMIPVSMHCTCKANFILSEMFLVHLKVGYTVCTICWNRNVFVANVFVCLGHKVFNICWNRNVFVANLFVFETWTCRLYHLLKSNCLCCKGKLGIKFSIFVGIEMSLLQTSLFIVGHKVFNIWWNRNVFVANVFVYSWTCRLYHCLCFFWMQWLVGIVFI